MEYTPVMNDKKWEELRLAMYELGELTPAWRIRNIESGSVGQWDKEWFYHFRDGGYKSIEWVEIKTLSPEQEVAVLEALSSIHVPGERISEGYRVYGHVQIGKNVDYL